MRTRVIPQKEWEKIYSMVPRISVELIIGYRGSVVLVRRGGKDLGPGIGKWHLPGKGILFGESVEHAIKRAASDETGLKVRVRKFLGYSEYLPPATFGHPISLVFLAETAGGRLHDRDGREIRLFKRLPKGIGFGHDRILKGAGFR